MGIDQSYSHTGIVVLNELGQIIGVNSIQNSNEVTKFYPNKHLDFKDCSAFKSGLIGEDCKLTKKKKDITKEEATLLKVSYQDRLKFSTRELNQLVISYSLFSDEGLVVGLEGISIFSKGATIDLARLLGSFETIIQLNDIPYSIFTPTQVKAFARKGNATKEDMISYVPEEDLNILKAHCPTDTKGKLIGLDNIVDAYWIAKLTMKSA